ncbi:MAG: LamB/YcsF family protein [Anaerolineae bacterium]|nr:LamB/YcsF family protein [Anaerolineae bacterium]
MRIDLNCDLGESFGHYRVGDDDAMLGIVTSANVACGVHAGDPVVMRQTAALAASNGVAIGAHPGYPDLQGFGRRILQLDAATLEAYVIYQLGALSAFTRVAGKPLVHVKPHGALYNLAATDAGTATAVARAVAAFDPALVVVTLPGSQLSLAARGLGLRVAHEGFADRAYRKDGTLVPRNVPGAIIHDPDVAARRAIQMVAEGTATTLEGETIPLRIDTLCVHGDTPGAVQIAAGLRARLEAAGVAIAPLTETSAA